jgi:hypothetical protein
MYGKTEQYFKGGNGMKSKLETEMSEKVNHPIHYNSYSVEVIDMMVAIWGNAKVADFCEINAFKYRMRAGLKGDSITDMKKEAWYLAKANELRRELLN